MQTSLDLLFYAALNYLNQSGSAFNRKFYFSLQTDNGILGSLFTNIRTQAKHVMMSCSVNPFGNSGRPSPTAGHLHRDLHPFHHKTKYMYNPSYIVTVGLEGAPQSHQCMGESTRQAPMLVGPWPVSVKKVISRPPASKNPLSPTLLHASLVVAQLPRPPIPYPQLNSRQTLF